MTTLHALRKRAGRREEPRNLGTLYPLHDATVRGTHAYRTLRELIVHGRLAPGTGISETTIARRLGMSRTPIRSALQRLTQEGYVNVVGVGRLSRASIAPLTREDAREVFALVAALEGVAAREAAALAAPVRAKLVARMRRLQADLRALSKSRSPDADRRFLNDTAFHYCYVEAAGPRLKALHEAVKPQAERYIRVYIRLLVGTSVAEHDAIVAALAGGDAEAAQRAVEANWRNAAERLGRVIDLAGEKGNW